jgi:hypothetical protein
MNERQRDTLLDEIHTTVVGSGSIPETVRVDDEPIPLREFYFEVADRELTARDHERVETVLASLRRERLALVQDIQDRAVDHETGQDYVSRIRDIDRAINALESLDDPSFEEQVRREKLDSARELIDMMREYGKL